MADSRPRLRGRAALAVAILTPVLVAACSSETSLPPQLQGRYGTTDSTYADRAFVLTSRELLLDLGEHGVEAHDIAEVRAEEKQDGRTLYEVVYLSAHQQEYTLSFYYDKNRPDRLVMENLPRVVWTRTGAAR